VAEQLPSLGVRIRAGVHTGEVEIRGSDLGGLAVHIAARIAEAARESEVLVSSTVKELLAGSGIHLEDRASTSSKGIPETGDRPRMIRQ
jgi:class 3 adenylate cyclase